MPIKKKEVMWEELEKFIGGAVIPSPHTHPRSEISDFWDAAFWGNIPDKPSTFPPSAHELAGAQHTASGLIAGHVIKATGASSFEWGPLSHSQLAGVTSDQHHAKAHNILSAAHPDTVAGAVARGDIIVGNATPKWSKMGKGPEDTFLGSDGTDLVWRDVDWTMIQSKPATYPPSNHVLDSGVHTASGLTAGHFLRATAPTTFAFQAIQTSDLPAHPLADAYHTAGGLIAGYVIRATGEASFEWGSLYHSDLSNVLANQHHPQSHSLASHSTKPHTALTGIGADDHHAKTHASNHQSGGDDQVGHDLLLGFVAAEHKSLPNTIAAVLSNHNVAIHNALNIAQLGTVGIGVWEGTAIGWAYISKTGSNLTDLVTRQHAGLTNVTANQHHAQSHVLGGEYHTASGLVVGHVIKAVGETSFEWAALSHGQLASVTANQHHARDHNLLSAVHPDTVVGSVTRGDIIVGNATPKWSKLSKGSVDTFLGSDGTDLVWRDVDWTMIQSKPGTFPPSAHTLASHSSKSHSELSTSPVNAHHDQLHSAEHGQAGDDLLKLDDLGTPDDNLDLNASTTRHGLLKKLTGSTANFLRADGAWSAPTSTPHNLLSSTHTDTGPQACVRGDMIVGNDGPLWSRLAKGSSGQFLKMGAYDPFWTFGLGVLLANWDAGSYQIRAKKFYSDQATGTAPFTVLSTTKVTNLNADLLEGYHASSAAGNNTIVLRTSSGYIYCSYLNCTSGPTTSEPTHYFVETGNDSFLRQMTPANFVAKLAADGLMPKSGGTFTGHVYAKDHGTAATDRIVNVCYGTGNPPTANTTTIGTLFVKYTL